MSVPKAHARARTRFFGRLILRRVFDAAHVRPRPHLFVATRPPGPDSVQSSN